MSRGISTQPQTRDRHLEEEVLWVVDEVRAAFTLLAQIIVTAVTAHTHKHTHTHTHTQTHKRQRRGFVHTRVSTTCMYNKHIVHAH